MPAPPAPPNNIPLASSLPRVSFRRIPKADELLFTGPAGVADQHIVNFGFNDGSEFERPEHYLRHVEPLEAERKAQVEYDMDEQDKEWLDALNADRRREQLDALSYESFEIIIDRLEKEWFDLVKRIPVRAPPPVIGSDGEAVEGESEDTACAICDDGECENSNAIVFCDGCNLAVHQDCYGIPYIPEGQWLCRKCTVSPDRAVSCVLCPHEGGAFKQTTQGKWAHLICAMWIPETGVSNPVYMEPIDSVERIPKARWKLQCYLCRHKTGACIQCDNKSCFTAFHVTCARQAGLLMKSTRQRAHHDDSDDEDSAEVLKACCHKHLPKHMRAKNGTAGDDGGTPTMAVTPTSARTPVGNGSAAQPRRRIKIVRRGASGSGGGGAASAGTSSAAVQSGGRKSARAYKKTYRAGPPLVPSYIITKVLDYIARIQVRKKAELVMRIARFWSLKREARRGAPLLKRLHLEPWTATKDGKEQTDAQRIKKLEFQFRLREDLEKIRMLAELVRKREKEKLRQIQLLRDTLVQGVLFPYHGVLRRVLEKVSGFDRSGMFLHPVSRTEVPDYFDVVKKPMDWTAIAEKLEDRQYDSVEAFQDDIKLVLSNAMLYNKPETSFHRAAQRILKACDGVFEELASLQRVHETSTSSSAALEELYLEPEDALLELLGDYDDEELVDTIADDEDAGAAPANIVEDLTRHYYRIDPPPAPAPRPPPRQRIKVARQSEAPVRASLRGTAPAAEEEEQEAAASEPGAQERTEEEKALKAARDEEREEARLRRQRSAIIASQASVAARQRRKREAEERAAATLAAKESGDTAALEAVEAAEAAAVAEQAEDNAAARRQRSTRQQQQRASSTPDEDRELVRKRSGIVEEPASLEVEQVDSWDSFKRFNVGWVLPEGSRRGNRTQGALEPLPKRIRTNSSVERGTPSTSAQVAASEASDDGQRPERKSRPSARRAPSSTQPGEAPTIIRYRGSQGQFIRATDDPSKERAPRPPKLDGGSRSASGSRVRKRAKKPSKQRKSTAAGDVAPSSPLSSAAEDSDATMEDVSMSASGVAVAFGDDDDEELSEPEEDSDAERERAREEARVQAERDRRNAMRREKARQKRVAEIRAQQEQKEKARKAKEARKQSLLAQSEADGTDAQEDDDDDQDLQPLPRPPAKTSKKGPALPEQGEPGDFEPGTMVWAKMQGYPHFPAETCDPEDDTVPIDVLEQRESAMALHPPSSVMHLVRFFDNSQSFGWVPTSSLRFLFEQDDVDQKLLRSKSSNHMRQSVRSAYQRAKAMLET